MTTFLSEYMETLKLSAEIDQMVAVESAKLHREWMRAPQSYRDQFGPNLSEEVAYTVQTTKLIAAMTKRNPAVAGTIEICLIPITDIAPEDRDPDELRALIPVVALVVAESGAMPDEVN